MSFPVTEFQYFAVYQMDKNNFFCNKMVGGGLRGGGVSMKIVCSIRFNHGSFNIFMVYNY